MLTMSTPPRRRWSLRLLGVAGAGAALLVASACGGGGQPTASGSSGSSASAAALTGRGPITFAQGKDVTGWTQGMVKGWNADHPDQKVTLRELPDNADQQRQQLLLNAQIKNADVAVIRLDAVWTAEFAANSYVDALPEGSVPLEGYLPQTISTVTYFNKVYAVPQQTGGGLFYYRKDLLDAAGLKPPTTWAEMKAACAMIKATAAGAGMDCYGGQFNKYEGLTVNFSEAVNSAGGTVITPDGKVQVSDDKAKQGLAFLVDSFKDGTIPKGARTWDEEAGRQAFQSGKLLFLRNWSYVYSLANKTDGSSKVAGKFAVAPLPGLNGPGVSTLGGLNLAISSFGTNKATALDFINYMTSADAQKQLMLKTSAPPPLASIYTDPDVVKKYPYMPVLLESIKTAQARPVAVRYGDVTLAIQDAASAAIAGQEPTDKAMTDLQSKLEVLVKP